MRTWGSERRPFLTTLILSGLILLWIGCRDEGSIHPFEPTPLPDAFLNSLSSDPSMLGLGGREATLTAYVVDADGMGAEGVEVAFVSDLGSVEATAVTDSSGIATAIFRSSNEKGTATVTASVGSFQLETTILIGANELTVDQNTALADGRSTIHVSATVYQVDGSAATLVPVTFSASAGEIPTTAVTDSAGRVEVVLTAPASETDVEAEISASVASEDVGTIPDHEGETQVVGVAVVTFRGITLTLSSVESELVASGKDSTDLRCLVAETVSKVPVQDLEVSFGTDLGSISSSASTEENGVATAVLVSGIYPGTAHLTALVETLRDSTHVAFTPLKLLPLKATPRQLLVSGGESILSTRLLNQNNNPVPDLDVRFETSLGVIPASDVTDSTGEVAVSLVSGDSAGTATVRAWFGSLSVETNVEIEEIIAEPIRLTALEFDPDFLYADGVTQAWVSTQLLNESNNPVVGGVVEFATDLGVIAETDSTDEEGIAAVWLTSIYSEDTVTANVTASHGSLSVSAPIQFLPPATRIPNALVLAPDTVHVQVAGVGGLESVLFRAVAFDASDDTVMSGFDVRFSIVSGPGGGEYLAWPDSGSGDSVTVPILDGTAPVSLTAGTISGVVAVKATAGEGVEATASVSIDAGPPNSAVIGVDSVDNIRFGGGIWLWTVNAVVRDRYSNPVSAGTPVYMSIHADSCGSTEAPEGLTIYGSVSTENVTNCSPGLPEPGMAYACLAAPHKEWTEFPSFAIQVRSGTNDLLACSRIDRGATDVAPASLALVEVERTKISVSGVGGEETSQLVFEVRDDLGRPLRPGNVRAVTFQLVAAPAGATLSRAADSTDTMGRVYTSVRSGTASGAIKVRATCEGITSDVVNVVVTGGPPDAAHFSLAAAKVNLAGRLLFGIEDDITAFVFDAYGNPVPEGTAVYFTSNFAGVEGSAVTDDVGRATARLYSAAPIPSCEDSGLVQITASTIDGASNTIEAKTKVLFSGSTTIAVSPSSFDIPNGGYQDFLITVADDCGSPLVELSSIKILASHGGLVGNTFVVMPDTRSRGATELWIRLSDESSLDTEAPIGATLTVEVTSSNGDGSLVVFGTID